MVSRRLAAILQSSGGLWQCVLSVASVEHSEETNGGFVDESLLEVTRADLSKLLALICNQDASHMGSSL